MSLRTWRFWIFYEGNKTFSHTLEELRTRISAGKSVGSEKDQFREKLVQKSAEMITVSLSVINGMQR